MLFAVLKIDALNPLSELILAHCSLGRIASETTWVTVINCITNRIIYSINAHSALWPLWFKSAI